MDTGQELHLRHQSNLQSVRPLISCDLVSHRAGVPGRRFLCAGYDLTFSPVKSVSTFWAVADPEVAALVERAHQAAVKDALAFIEKHALFTRTRPQGIRQVKVRGLVATAFTHRDSRAGDPDLHTHVAVANKVQTSMDGGCRSTDGCCSKPTLPRRRPITPPWSSTFATIWGCGSPSGPAPTRRSGRPGDRRRRPSTERALVDSPGSHRDPPR
jgi:hypothetical protein